MRNAKGGREKFGADWWCFVAFRQAEYGERVVMLDFTGTLTGKDHSEFEL